MMGSVGKALAVAVYAIGAVAFAGEDSAEPTDYRMDHYRAPVPEALAGATVVSDAEAHALWQAGQTAFIDVLPQAPKPQNLPKNTIWRDRPRHSIPGAIWLPNVGYGAIHETVDAYFQAGLEIATGGDKDHPVLFFCLAECWMSWNAAKRAIEDYGYTEVYWYPEGTDGWVFEDFPVEKTPRFKPPGDGS